MFYFDRRLFSVMSILFIVIALVSVQAAEKAFDPNEGVIFVEQEDQSTYMKGFPPIEDKLINSYSMDWLLDNDKSRWSMQNISTILHTAAVSRGHQKIAYLQRNDKQLLDRKFTEIPMGDWCGSIY